MLCHHPGALRLLPRRAAVAPSISPRRVWRRRPGDQGATPTHVPSARVAASLAVRRARPIDAWRLDCNQPDPERNASMADTSTRFDRRIAGRMRAESQALAKRWLERLDDILTVDRDRIFPTKDLLDHVPLLIEEIAAYIEAPEVEELAANSAVVAKAREMGLLRYAQQASVHQLLREYHVLGGILETFVSEETIAVESATSPREALAVASRISHGLRVLQQTTIDTFIAQYTDRIAAQHARLEGFNRLVSHELRQPLGTLQFSIRTLGTPIAADAVKRERLVEVATANVQRLIDLTRRLEQIARLQHREEDDPDRQEVDLSALAREVARQLRDMADKRDVAIRIAEDLPVIVTDVARVELVLMNLISNAIKYSDASKPER